MTREELVKVLDSNIPEDVIEKRSGGGGKELSYLSGAYVIDRLNQVLGIGEWSYSIESLTKVFEGEVAGYSGDVKSVSYTAIVQLEASIAGKRVFFTEVGYGDGTDKKNAGKAHELAVKEAVTDGVKRAAKNLGRSMGLGLYFKEGQYVGETSDAVDKSATKETKAVSGVGNESNTGRSEGSKSNGSKAGNIKVLRTQIKSAFAVLQDQKKITKEAFISEYTKGTTVDDLDDANINVVIEKLKTNYPELGL